MYPTQEFETTIKHLNNVTAIPIDNIKSAVATALAKAKVPKNW
jgi:hypothetical protein